MKLGGRCQKAGTKWSEVSLFGHHAKTGENWEEGESVMVTSPAVTRVEEPFWPLAADEGVEL